MPQSTKKSEMAPATGLEDTNEDEKRARRRSTTSRLAYIKREVGRIRKEVEDNKLSEAQADTELARLRNYYSGHFLRLF